jgi:hypothetical protein
MAVAPAKAKVAEVIAMQQQAAEAPVEEAPVEEAPVEEAPVEEAPVEEAPVEEAPVETPLPDNDDVINVRNDHTAFVAGIAPGSTGEVKYGIFKSSIGLVEI